MILYDYFRSTACYRVRIALNLKGIAYDKQEIHLINGGGEQHQAAYKSINPQSLVPSLDDKGNLIHQSLAIIEYLEDLDPEVPLLPQDPLIKAHLRSLALSIACDMHPLNNLRVLNYLKTDLEASEEEVRAWYHHWLKLGFDAFEEDLKKLPRVKPLCYGAHPSLADIFLIPQVYNALRFDFNMDAYPLIKEINAYCLGLAAFADAAP